MSDERRERYAAALYESANPGLLWVDVQEGTLNQDAWLDETEAAMAVADEEMDAVRARAQENWREACRQRNEVARLRAELSRLVAILRLTDGRPGYHTITVKAILSAGGDDV